MTRAEFIQKIATQDLTRVGQAIALLWFYRKNQIFDERTASELATDLADEGLGKPNVSDLRKGLVKDKKTVKGKRRDTFQINVKFLDELNERFEFIAEKKHIEVSSSVLPQNIASGTRAYLERMAMQINGSYDYEFFDATAVMLRRLMESLIIEVFIHKGIADQIKADKKFWGLDDLIKAIANHKDIHLSKPAEKIMSKIKFLGDTAAHDRTFITQRQDIDDVKIEARKLFQELLSLSGIVK